MAWLPPVNLPDLSQQKDYGAQLYKMISGVGDSIYQGRRDKVGDQQWQQEQERLLAAQAQQQANADRNYAHELDKFNWGKEQWAQEQAQPDTDGYRPLTDPAERQLWGIPETDTTPFAINGNNDIKKIGGAATNVTVNGDMRLTEGQSKDLGFYYRGTAADKTLTPELESALTSLPDVLWSENAGKFGNYGQTEEFQVAKRAASEFLAIVLRKDTGAAVTPQEFALYGPMYLPMPGDSPGALAAKRQARATVMKAVRRGLGSVQGLADEIDAELGGAQSPAGPQAPAGGGQIIHMPDGTPVEILEE